MLEVAGAVVCACFALCWAAFILANLMQIRHTNAKNRQILNHYLSRTSVVFAVGMFIDNLATFADYFLVGEAFEVMYVFGVIMRTLIAQIAVAMLSFTTYQALLAAYILEVVVNDSTTSSLRRKFIAVNAFSTVWSLVVTVIMLILNRRWLAGLVSVMWAVVGLLLGLFFWYYFMLLIRTARSTAKSLGVERVQNSLIKPVLTTALATVLVLGLVGSGILYMLDMEAPHHRGYIEPYIPVDELLLLLACTTSTVFAWLPLKTIESPKKITSLEQRYVF
jgi:hypothetical protein